MIHPMIPVFRAPDWTVKKRLLIRNPTDSYVVPKVQHQEMKTLHPEDLKVYLSAAERRGPLAMFYLELVSGIRKGELVALLVREHTKHPDFPWFFPSSRTGAMYHPDSVAILHQQILKGTEFTLPTYTHTTRQKQDETALVMGNLIAQVR